MPHFNPRQRAILRSLLGAIAALLVIVTMLVLMALLLVFPKGAAGMDIVPSVPVPLLMKLWPGLRE
jgi:hypothetical protein